MCCKGVQCQEQKDKLQHAGQTAAFFGDLELIVLSTSVINKTNQNFQKPLFLHKTKERQYFVTI